MNSNTSDYFKKCLETSRIRSFSRGKALAPKEIELARADLSRGVDTFKRGDYKWSTVQAYYSMFHSARALIYHRNFREKSHACLIEAVRTLYVQEGKLGYQLVEAMIEAKRLREDADYYGDFSQANAKELLKKAKEFYVAAKEILYSSSENNKN